MKKIIKGKKYDTETAQKIDWDSNHESGFSHYTETLYRKRTGEYFILGEGGPASKYHCRFDGMLSGDTQVVPLSYDQARAWAEEHMRTDDYEEEFGEVSEDDASGQIAELVKRSGLNQREFAEKYRIPLRTLENWCSGNRQPPEYVAYLLQLAMDK